MKIHHVGYLTKNLEASEKEFLKLGFKVEQDMQTDNVRKLNISFLINECYRVELIQPRDSNSPLYPLLKKYKNTPYHFCYIVDELSEAIPNLESEGYHVIQPPLEASCIKNQKVAFLVHGDMGIIELVEEHGGLA